MGGGGEKWGMKKKKKNKINNVNFQKRKNYIINGYLNKEMRKNI